MATAVIIIISVAVGLLFGYIISDVNMKTLILKSKDIDELKTKL